MAKQFERPDLPPTHDEIAQRAYALFEENGRHPGHEMENWLEAESQLMAAIESKAKGRPNANGAAKSSSRHSAGHRR